MTKVTRGMPEAPSSRLASIAPATVEWVSGIFILNPRQSGDRTDTNTIDNTQRI